MIIYYGGIEIVDAPRIFPTFTGRNFGMDFYTTDIREQANEMGKTAITDKE
jgi:hypothetical protein